MAKEAKSTVVPKLRFPEFWHAGGWETVPLEDIAERVSTKNSDGDVTRVLTNSAEYGVLDQRDYFDRDIATAGKVDGYYIVDTGDYVYNPRTSAIAPVGPISRNNIGKGVMSPLYTVFRFAAGKTDFYEHYFRSTSWHSYLRSAASTGARHDRMAITPGVFMRMPVPTPVQPEQQKIADCLTSLDKVIAAQGRKVAALKAYKRSLMQQLFPRAGETIPRLRFPEFHAGPEWGESPLNTLAKRVTTRNLGMGQTRVLTNSAEFGVVDQGTFFEREIVTRDNLDTYFVVETGDFVYNPRVSAIAPVGPVSRNNLGQGVMSPLYTVFRFTSPSTDYFVHLFRAAAWHRQLRQASNSGARHDRMSISADDFMDLRLPVPFLPEEQQRVADCLSSLDAQTTPESEKLDALKAHKKGLMQKLFASPEEV